MTSLILSTAIRYLMSILLLLSIYLLLRGHYSPGGGFVGGLVAASAFSLYTIANGVEMARRVLRVDPRTLIALGLLFAVLSACVSLVFGYPFMTGIWSETLFPVIGKFGTPLLFDTGIYLVVVGVALMIILTLAED
jgi:multicomponent Na+:H+ antiporter subunit B